MSEGANRDFESRETVAAELDSCIKLILKDDSELLISKVNERTVTQRLAIYLQSKFPDWHVDCEYNRLHDEVKRLRLRHGIVPVVPDIIAHMRKSQENLFVIEAKKNDDPRGENGDIERLQAFKDQLGYKHAIFLKLVTGKKPGIETVWI